MSTTDVKREPETYYINGAVEFVKIELIEMETKSGSSKRKLEDFIDDFVRDELTFDYDNGVTDILVEEPKPRTMYTIHKRPELGCVYAGNVVKVTPFGVYVQLEGFLENHKGFLHVQQMNIPSKIGDAWNMVGERVFVKVTSMQLDQQQITLSMKGVDQKTGADLRPTAGATPRSFADHPEVGRVYAGKVVKKNARHCSIRIEDLRTHWQGSLVRTELNSTNLKIGDKVLVLVTSILNRRVILSVQSVNQETGEDLLSASCEAHLATNEGFPPAKKARADGVVKLRVDYDSPCLLPSNFCETIEFPNANLIIPDAYGYPKQGQVFSRDIIGVS